MSARPTWKGVLKISLVSIPIKVFPATDTSAVLDFHQLHKECRTRITQRRWCVKCAREVPYAEIEKGHEFEKDKYVVLSETEFDAVKPESAKVIELVQFAEAAALDPLYVDRSYYLTPGSDLGSEAFAVMRAAMRGSVGIGKLAIYGREYLVAVRTTAVKNSAGAETLTEPLLLHTLHHQAEIRPVDHVLDDDVAAVRAPIDQVQIARKLIASFMKPTLKLEKFSDEYQADLKKLIEKKIAGEEIIEAPSAWAATSNVVNLKDALTRSLRLVSGSKKPAAPATSERGARPRKRA
jgi:DNA end-binding protein Ku